MKNTSKYYPFLLAGLLVGFAVGAITGHIINVKAVGSPTVNLSSSIPTNGQRNILFMGVDRLDNNSPQLESVWLVLLFPDNPRVVLIPIFTPNNGFLTQQDDAIVKSFKLMKGGNLSRTFLEELETMNFWWTDTIIADRIAIVEISRIIRDANSVGSSKVNMSIFKSSLKSRLDSPNYARKQLSKISSICQGAHHTISRNNLSSTMKLFTKHIRTSLKTQELIKQIEQRSSTQGGLICEFPTFHP